MKKYSFIIICIAAVALLVGGTVFAQGTTQGMMGGNGINADGHTAREEAEGKVVWKKLQAQQTTCADLTDENFGTLGEYFMGQMMGTSHEAMNNMMIQMMGEQGEEQMHVVMGKRLSDCDTSAALPSQGIGFMPMMQMMVKGGENPMMNFGFMPFGGFGWIFMILWWVLIIAGIAAIIQWLTHQSRGTGDHGSRTGGSSLEILKERYAKGEIDKKEFVDKKKDLT